MKFFIWFSNYCVVPVHFLCAGGSTHYCVRRALGAVLRRSSEVSKTMPGELLSPAPGRGGETPPEGRRATSQKWWTFLNVSLLSCRWNCGNQITKLKYDRQVCSTLELSQTFVSKSVEVWLYRLGISEFIKLYTKCLYFRGCRLNHVIFFMIKSLIGSKIIPIFIPQAVAGFRP